MSVDRNAVRRAIFGACRARGIDDDARHALQLRVVGKASLTTMTTGELQQVLRAVRTGRTAKAADRAAEPAGQLLPRGAHQGKLSALWISGYHLGVVRSADPEALATWVCRQTGLGSARWATPGHTAACIEALKEWIAREAGVDWSLGDPRAAVMEALWRLLAQAGAVDDPSGEALDVWVRGIHPGRDRADLAAPELDDLIVRLGHWRRQAEEGAA